MQRFIWDSAKDAQLREQRGIGFEEIIFHIACGDLVEVLIHPNRERYPGQRIFVVWCRQYAYLIPYVETAEEIFLKTIIPSRKFTKRIRRQKEAEL